MNITEEKICNVNTLIYTGSQQTFISDLVVNELTFKLLDQVHKYEIEIERIRNCG